MLQISKKCETGRMCQVELDQLLAGKTPSAAARVLDVGCGNQPFPSRIESTGVSYRPLDASSHDGVSIDVIARIDQPDLPEAIYQDGPYDLILCSEVLEHVAEWDVAFANFYSLLARSGHLILTCPHFFPLHEEPYDFWRPTPYAISFFAEKYGLVVEKEQRLGTGWDVLGTLLARQRFQTRSRALRSRLLTRMCNSIRWRLLGWLRSGYFQKSVADNGPFYLANCFVLRKDQ
jgi:SAM-dependent methyltransferase